MDARAIVAIILAACIGAAITIGMAGGVIGGRPLSENGSEALIALGGAIVGGLVAWLTLGRKNDTN